MSRHGVFGAAGEETGCWFSKTGGVLHNHRWQEFLNIPPQNFALASDTIKPFYLSWHIYPVL